MAITNADWIAVSDPFVAASGHTIASVTSDWTNFREWLHSADGFLGALVSDRNIQEIYWERDNDKTKTFNAVAIDQDGTGVNQDGLEVGPIDYDGGAGYLKFVPDDYFSPGAKNVFISFKGRSSGANRYSLFAYTAHAWISKDPAQLLFSILGYYLRSEVDTRDYLDKVSFQAASDYYDLNPLPLSLWREVGLTLAGQVKKIIDHTPDFISIRPADADGKLQLHISPRQTGLTRRTTPIDLASASVAKYQVTPTDRHTIDRITATFGGVFMSYYFRPDEATDFLSDRPLDLPGRNRVALIQKHGPAGRGRALDLDLPYSPHINAIANHVDLAYWSKDQAEISLSFADWSHLNFDVGDVVTVSSTQAGFAAEEFLVTEKTLDLDTMLADVRLLQLIGVAGRRPSYIDAANWIIGLTPNTLGDYFEADATYPRTVALTTEPRNLDRVRGLIGHVHGVKMARGISPAAPEILVDDINGWPTLRFGGAGYSTLMGLDFKVDTNAGLQAPATSTPGNFTAYFVVDLQNITGAMSFYTYASGIYVLGFRAVGAGAFQYKDSTGWVGSAAFSPGLQLLTFNLDVAGSSIRRNGVVIESGLPYVAQQLVSSGDHAVGINSAGTLNALKGELAEFHLFASAHTAAQMLDVETSLAEKYAITI